MAGALLINGVLFMFAYGLFQDPQVRNYLAQWLAEANTAVDVTPIADSTGDTDKVVSVVAAASPAVVSIVVSQDVPIMERYYEEYQNPFGSFQLPKYRQNGTREQEIAGGSGFLVSADGYIVTNNHVIEADDAKYAVFLNDGTTYDAQVIATDDMLDVALLKIDATELRYLEFGNSEDIQVGQTVVAIGNALGEFRNTVSVGVISGLSRTIFASTSNGSAERLQDILQTDAAINPGNSGGPLLDMSGKVIGVNVAASFGSAENIGFALPANAVKEVIASLQEHGRVIRPWLGIRYDLLTPEYAQENDLPVTYGALVRRGDDGSVAVVPGAPADKAGIEENDIILEIDGQRIDEEHDLSYLIRTKAVGDVLSLKILHDGEERIVSVTLEERIEE